MKALAHGKLNTKSRPCIVDRQQKKRPSITRKKPHTSTNTPHPPDQLTIQRNKGCESANQPKTATRKLVNGLAMPKKGATKGSWLTKYKYANQPWHTNKQRMAKRPKVRKCMIMLCSKDSKFIVPKAVSPWARWDAVHLQYTATLIRTSNHEPKAPQYVPKKAVKKKVCSFIPSAASGFHGSVAHARGAKDSKVTKTATHGHV